MVGAAPAALRSVGLAVVGSALSAAASLVAVALRLPPARQVAAGLVAVAMPSGLPCKHRRRMVSCPPSGPHGGERERQTRWRHAQRQHVRG